MPRLLLLIVSASLVLSACAPSRPATAPPAEPGPRPAGDLFLAGYHPWWMQGAWRTYDLAAVDELMFFELRVQENGQFENRHGWPTAWADLIGQAKANGTTVVPTLSVSSPEVFSTLFQSELKRKLLLESAMEAVRSAEAGGIHLDFEIFTDVPAEAKAGFQQFVAELRAALSNYRPDARLSLFLPAVDYGDVYDETALAALADFLVVQGYDIHWPGGDRAGPVAPLSGWGRTNWETIVQRYLDQGVPAGKIVMAVPFYGYEWPTESDRPGARTRGRGQSITYAAVDTTFLRSRRIAAQDRVAAYGLLRDEASGSPYYVYQDSTGWHQGWFEDEESLAAKVAFARRHGLAGIAAFPLGYDNGQLLQALEGYLQQPQGLGASTQ